MLMPVEAREWPVEPRDGLRPGEPVGLMKRK